MPIERKSSSRLDQRQSKLASEAAPDRSAIIIKSAAKLFSQEGFEAASMRAIASLAGITAPTIYWHFKSKEDLYLAVHDAGIQLIHDAVTAAIVELKDPWDRLEAAAAAHCDALLGSGDMGSMLDPHVPAGLASFRNQIISRRDDYERLIVGIIDAVKLPPEIDRRIFRMHFLGALNWTTVWYRPGKGVSPKDIGRQLVLMLHGVRRR